MKRDGALVQNGRTQGRPKHAHESVGFKRKAPSKPSFHRRSVFSKAWERREERDGEGRNRVGRREGDGERHGADNSGLRIRFLCLGRQTQAAS